MVSQNVIPSEPKHGGRRKLPYVFTEQGVAMLSSVLRSAKAIEVNINIMRAFVALRQHAMHYENLAVFNIYSRADYGTAHVTQGQWTLIVRKAGHYTNRLYIDLHEIKRPQGANTRTLAGAMAYYTSGSASTDIQIYLENSSAINYGTYAVFSKLTEGTRFNFSGAFSGTHTAPSGMVSQTLHSSTQGLTSNGFVVPRVAGFFTEGNSRTDAVYLGGDVGIGTNDPSARLHVVGSAYVTGSIFDSGGSGGTAGQVLTSTGAGTDWVNKDHPMGFHSNSCKSGYTFVATTNSSLGLGLCARLFDATPSSNVKTSFHNMQDCINDGGRPATALENYLMINNDAGDWATVTSHSGNSFRMYADGGMMYSAGSAQSGFQGVAMNPEVDGSGNSVRLQNDSTRRMSLGDTDWDYLDRTNEVDDSGRVVCVY